MTIFDVLSMIGGLVLFLFGMNVMGNALEKRAGNRLKSILGSMTSNVFRGFILGLGVTAIIQSSSATTVMVVGFVNSGLMTLRQATGVIMGANLGSSMTSWLISMTAIEGDSLWIQLLKPSSFTPVLAFIGLILYMFQKNAKRKDTGLILIGFSVLMFGMEMMSSSVAGLQEVPQFRQALVLFSNPIVGVLVGAAFTAMIQSSAASVGVLQALTSTGFVTYATVIPVVMGQNIGTCVSAMISSVGASRNAKRAAVVHLLFNVLATLILLPLYYLLEYFFRFAFVETAANPVGIAAVHTIFKLLALAVLMPLSGLLEKLACRIVPDAKEDEETQLLDERLLAAPAVAIERCREVAVSMAELSLTSLQDSLTLLTEYDPSKAQPLREAEDKVDMYEDKLGTYLVKLSSHPMAEADSAQASELLHLIGDFERISDHSVNILESVEEMQDKRITFSPEAQHEIAVMAGAVHEILDLSLAAFRDQDLDAAVMVEPLEQVVDALRDEIKKNHINRLQKQECTIEMGFVLTDILTNLERVSDHCSNIAGCMLEMQHDSLDMHQYLRSVKENGENEYKNYFNYFSMKYSVN